MRFPYLCDQTVVSVFLSLAFRDCIACSVLFDPDAVVSEMQESLDREVDAMEKKMDHIRDPLDPRDDGHSSDQSMEDMQDVSASVEMSMQSTLDR